MEPEEEEEGSLTTCPGWDANPCQPRVMMMMMMMILFGLWEEKTLQGKGRYMQGLRTTGVPGWPNLPRGDAGYPGDRRVSLFGSGHEAVLDAEHNEGVLAAAGLLLQ